MSSKTDSFIQVVWDYYDQHARDLPWRHTDDPYAIFVSEMMLQQTQVARVIPKYQMFLKEFPTVQALAKAQLSDVLKAWNGLGYNRRAKFLHEAAKIITEELNGKFPKTVEQLSLLPGIGKNTAGAILAYAFNIPVVFIETNIRTVFIHHFFADKIDVADKELIPLIESTLDPSSPRIWYWALMDYGAYLKSSVGNLSRGSKHYTKQSRFEGSQRQIRGKVLKILAQKPMNTAELMDVIEDERLDNVLKELCSEKLVSLKGSKYHLG